MKFNRAMFLYEIMKSKVLLNVKDEKVMFPCGIVVEKLLA